MQYVRRCVKHGSKIYLQQGSTPPTEVDDDATIVWLNCRDFDASESYEWSSFFSTYEPDYLYEKLIESMRSENINFTLSEKYWKISFEYKRAIGATADSAGAAEEFIEKF